jgi:hypothetical protein
MNDDKTAIVLFTNIHSRNQVKIDIELNNITLESVPATKYLGLYIDQNLNFKMHVNKLCNKLSSSVFALRTLRNMVDPKILLIVYYALFQSHLGYCIILWGNSSKGNISRVLIIKKKCTWVIAGLQYNESCRTPFKTQGILTVVCLYIYMILVYVKNNLNLLLQDPVNHSYQTEQKQLYTSYETHHLYIWKVCILCRTSVV